MEYSPNNDAAYGFPCCMFGADSHYRGAFVNREFTSWSNILVWAKDHAKSDYHLSAACRWQCVMETDINVISGTAVASPPKSGIKGARVSRKLALEQFFQEPPVSSCITTVQPVT